MKKQNKKLQLRKTTVQLLNQHDNMPVHGEFATGNNAVNNNRTDTAVITLITFVITW
jgi:hypothetical protein